MPQLYRDNSIPSGQLPELHVLIALIDALSQLQSIRKLRVLNISQIKPSAYSVSSHSIMTLVMDVLLVLQFDIVRAGPDQGLLLVLAVIPPPDEGKIHQTHAVNYDNEDFGRHIAWCILRTKGLRAC